MVAIVVLGFCDLLLGLSSAPANLPSQDTVAAAGHFARINDSDNSSTAHNQVSSSLRLARNEQEVVNAIERSQHLLGPVLRRQLTALRSSGIYPRFPDGDYPIVQLDARTLHQDRAAEVILPRHLDGVWQVADYGIR
ncbi:MAG: DUF4019 domain-containing protein [Desulfuromonadales bacterium]|nr:DUF4019 domain-containing protein [Desulfuromonadales bacterium]